MVFVRGMETVGPGEYCPPRDSTHFEASSLELNGIL